MTWRWAVRRWRSNEIPDSQLRAELRAVVWLAGRLARDGRIGVDTALYELRLSALAVGFDDLDRLLDGFNVM